MLKKLHEHNKLTCTLQQITRQSRPRDPIITLKSMLRKLHDHNELSAYIIQNHSTKQIKRTHYNFEK